MSLLGKQIKTSENDLDCSVGHSPCPVHQLTDFIVANQFKKVQEGHAPFQRLKFDASAVTPQTVILIFNLSPFTISSSLPKNSSISQVQLIYLPASYSLFLRVKNAIVSPGNSTVSVNRPCASSGIFIPISVMMPPR